MIEAIMAKSEVITRSDDCVYPTAPGQYPNSSSGLTIREHFAVEAMQALLGKHGAASLRDDGVYVRDLPASLVELDASDCPEYAQKRRQYSAELTALNRVYLAREAVAMADALIDALNAQEPVARKLGVTMCVRST